MKAAEEMTKIGESVKDVQNVNELKAKVNQNNDPLNNIKKSETVCGTVKDKNKANEFDEELKD